MPTNEGFVATLKKDGKAERESEEAGKIWGTLEQYPKDRPAVSKNRP